MSESKIEWTGSTWNPTTGCTKVSAGCKHCYAETMAHRLKAMQVKGYGNGFELALHPDRLKVPMTVKRPTIWFVNSMSDLFHPKIPFTFVDKVMDTIAKTPQHTYQILTKRPGRMRQFYNTTSRYWGHSVDYSRAAPYNTWVGTSVENKRHGIPRIDMLRDIKARIRFLSIEPLLEHLGELDLTGIHWVIVGGESGKGARPMRSEWVESIQRQCAEQNIPFFFKQWGAYNETGQPGSKKANGRLFQQREWNAMPQTGQPQPTQADIFTAPTLTARETEIATSF